MKMAILRALSILALNLLCLLAATQAEVRRPPSEEALAGLIQEYCAEEPGFLQFQWGSQLLEQFPEAINWPIMTQPSRSAKEAAKAAILESIR